MVKRYNGNKVKGESEITKYYSTTVQVFMMHLVVFIWVVFISENWVIRMNFHLKDKLQNN